MEQIDEFMALKASKITSVETGLGYMQVLEYFLQDGSTLHIVQWYLNNNFDVNTLEPIQFNKSFYNDEKAALKFAHEIGNELLQQYLI